MYFTKIDNFNKLQWSWIVFLSVLLCIGCKTGQTGKKNIGGSHTNVLLLLVDDLRPELHSYGKSYMHTPNIDRLAATGLQFERAYVEEAVCAPSRNTLLTGLRPDTLGIYHLDTPLKKAKPNIVTLPRLFRKNEYQTISIGGKVFHHHTKDDPQAWSKNPIRVTGQWRGRGYVTPQNIATMQAYSKKHPQWNGKGPAFEAAEVADTVYPDGKIANRAIDQLQQLKKSQKPFFLALGFERPHLPFCSPRKYWDMYPPETVSLPDNYFAPQDTNQYSLTNFGELRSYSNIPKGHRLVPDSTAKSLIRAYRASTSYVDAQIGRVLARLDELGLSKNTIVVLWGDHGFKLGEHASWSKHTNYETDTHIPIIIRVPGMKTAGQKSEAFVETVDIYPTLAELCGLKAPNNLQGRSIVPLLKDPNRSWKSAALSQYPRGDDIMGYSMRTRRYRYTEWVNRSTGQVKARELYDHHSDPEENANVIKDKKYKSTIDSLSMLLHQRWKKSLTPGGI